MSPHEPRHAETGQVLTQAPMHLRTLAPDPAAWLNTLRSGHGAVDAQTMGKRTRPLPTGRIEGKPT
jgi:hypothetical protein